jgi:uncharacterized protein
VILIRILLAGGTGFVGKALAILLLQENNAVYILTRSIPSKKYHSNIHYIHWDELHTLFNVDAVINLAGDPLNSGRWTTSKKARILSSRITTTRKLVSFCEQLQRKPTVFINASAVGYYGTSLCETFTEDTTANGQDFLAHTVVAWEKEATKANELGIRTVLVRFGVILGANEGALPRIVFPYRLFVGGTIASGKQWVSWIHITDAVSLILYAIHNNKIEGALNVTAPYPVTMQQLGECVAKVLKRPHWFPVPRICLRLLLGEMSTLVVDGQKVIPKKAEEYGFTFQYSYIETALNDLLK